MPRHSNLSFAFVFILGALLQESVAIAAKMELIGGYFSLTAKTSNGTANVAYPGAIRSAYYINATDNLDVGMGYSLYALGTSDDIGYGLDLSINYFPFTLNRVITIESSRVTWQQTEIWRPYLGGGFHQRQYQSVQSVYAGPSFAIGTEIALSGRLSAKLEARALLLRGPLKASLNESNLLGGLVWGL